MPASASRSSAVQRGQPGRRIARWTMDADHRGSGESWVGVRDGRLEPGHRLPDRSDRPHHIVDEATFALGWRRHQHVALGGKQVDLVYRGRISGRHAVILSLRTSRAEPPRDESVRSDVASGSSGSRARIGPTGGVHGRAIRGPRDSDWSPLIVSEASPPRRAHERGHSLGPRGLDRPAPLESASTQDGVKGGPVIGTPFGRWAHHPTTRTHRAATVAAWRGPRRR